nr:hypothetical protein CFP56_23965 [Quercus suber]
MIANAGPKPAETADHADARRGTRCGVATDQVQTYHDGSKPGRSTCSHARRVVTSTLKSSLCVEIDLVLVILHGRLSNIADVRDSSAAPAASALILYHSVTHLAIGVGQESRCNALGSHHGRGRQGSWIENAPGEDSSISETCSLRGHEKALCARRLYTSLLMLMVASPTTVSIVFGETSMGRGKGREESRRFAR